MHILGSKIKQKIIHFWRIRGGSSKVDRQFWEYFMENTIVSLWMNGNTYSSRNVLANSWLHFGLASPRNWLLLVTAPCLLVALSGPAESLPNWQRGQHCLWQIYIWWLFWQKGKVSVSTSIDLRNHFKLPLWFVLDCFWYCKLEHVCQDLAASLPQSALWQNLFLARLAQLWSSTVS